MSPEPDVPQEWLHIAGRELRFAQAPDAEEPWATRCFLLQQAAEKSLKAVLLYLGAEFPRTHNLTVLVGLLPPQVTPPAEVHEASLLTRYAVTTRYPRFYETVTRQDYERALQLASAVVAWAQSVLAGRG
jgi:HEPN domain-containing protein